MQPIGLYTHGYIPCSPTCMYDNLPKIIIGYQSFRCHKLSLLLYLFYSVTPALALHTSSDCVPLIILPNFLCQDSGSLWLLPNAKIVSALLLPDRLSSEQPSIYGHTHGQTNSAASWHCEVNPSLYHLDVHTD